MQFRDNGQTLTIETDSIEVTTIGPDYRPDPTWVHTDEYGHVHRWVGNRVPTTYPVTVDWIDGDGDSRTETTHHCNLCRVEVEPDYEEVPGTGGGVRRFIPGMTHYYIDGQEVTKVEADAFVALHNPR